MAQFYRVYTFHEYPTLYTGPQVRSSQEREVGPGLCSVINICAGVRQDKRIVLGVQKEAPRV